jgi:hypothetical protein
MRSFANLGSFVRTVCREPLAFAADAVRQWKLKRLSPGNDGMFKIELKIVRVA